MISSVALARGELGRRLPKPIVLSVEGSETVTKQHLLMLEVHESG